MTSAFMKQINVNTFVLMITDTKAFNILFYCC